MQPWRDTGPDVNIEKQSLMTLKAHSRIQSKYRAAETSVIDIDIHNSMESSSEINIRKRTAFHGNVIYQNGRQGKVRLQKWYLSYPEKEKKKIMRELIPVILSRKPKMCSVLDWRDKKIVYRRYASLYFCCAVDPGDNELITLEIIHRYVEILDRYFGSVCELDIIFHFEKAYYVLDELILCGELQESSKEDTLRDVDSQDLLQERKYTQVYQTNFLRLIIA
ncbi:AP-1 complex subunit sigma-2 [Hymenolepis weldensis]